MLRILSVFGIIFLLLNPVYGNDSNTIIDLSNERVNKQNLMKKDSFSSAPGGIEDKEKGSKYGFLALWQQSDWVARSALIILLIMSLGTWTIFFVKFLEQSKINKECIKVNQLSKQGEPLKQIVTYLPKSSLLHIVYNAGKEAKLQTKSLDNAIEPSNWVGEGIQNGISGVSGNLQSGLTFLATVGSTAPFVGLFGTVWAIYHALIKIGDSGQASLDKVAGPVGEALIMTAIGLAVAVPAVLGYNWLVRRNKILINKIITFGNILYISFFVNH